MLASRHMTATPKLIADSFAANRATGFVAFETKVSDGKSRRGVVQEEGSLRVRFPAPDTRGLSAVLVNTAGGVAGGDRFGVTIEAGVDSAVTLTTAAAEKVYRSHGPNADIDVRLTGSDNSHIAWLPQETILFDSARLSRRFDIDLSETASLLLAEIVVFGRTAMNETVRTGSYEDRWRLRRAGRLVFAETLRLDGDIGAKLARKVIAEGSAAIATVLIAPGHDEIVDRIREASDMFGGEVGASCWNGIAMVRFCAVDSATVRRDVMTVLARIDAQALPRIWSN